MAENAKYPINHAPKNDPTWGTKILASSSAIPAVKPFRSPKNQFDGWTWLIPAGKALPADFVLDANCDIQCLRSSVGYVYNGDPIESSVPVCLLADSNIILLPRLLDELLFSNWEKIAIQTGNKGKLFEIAVPVVPTRFYRTISEKAKYHYLQHNFSQVQIQNGVPSTSYLTGTPQPLAFDPKNMPGTVAKPQDFSFDAQRIFDQNLDPSGIQLHTLLASASTLTTKKRPATEIQTTTPSTPEPEVVESQPEVTAEAPPKKQRKAPTKKTTPSTGARGKSKTNPEPTPVETPLPVVVPQPVVVTQPVVVEAPNPVPNNKQNVIELIRKIREDRRFQKVKKNLLDKVPEELGKAPDSPQTKKTLLVLAQFADVYLTNEWSLAETKKDDFLDSLFAL